MRVPPPPPGKHYAAGQPCQQGQTAARTGCTPASGEGTPPAAPGPAGPDFLESVEPDSFDEELARDFPQEVGPAFQQLRGAIDAHWELLGGDGASPEDLQRSAAAVTQARAAFDEASSLDNLL